MIALPFYLPLTASLIVFAWSLYARKPRELQRHVAHLDRARKRRWRLWRTTEALSIAAVFASVALLIINWYGFLRFRNSHTTIVCMSGTLSVRVPEPKLWPVLGWRWKTDVRGYAFTPLTPVRIDTVPASFAIELWFPALMFSAFSFYAHQRSRRLFLYSTVCTSCRYDRVGISPAAPCPECGMPAPMLATCFPAESTPPHDH